ncbi:MAG: Shikimate dehydrogenase [Bacteroidetes bacterium ADurb.Bin008]|jgi:shikimate dehydrogenase|nr:MAG: Shikimate dehydrogenase [Bacteroidetes bacterium ADurb.Bin008]
MKSSTDKLQSSKRYYAVFGNPILHSKSPQLFNSVFEGQGIDAVFTRIRTLSGHDVIVLIRNLNLSGASITTPFKEEVMPFLDSISEEAKRIGGVNTIVNNNGKLSGYNTDHHGVTNSLTESGLTLHGLKCLVLGAGPAGRAAVYGLMTGGAEVTISNRTPGRAQLIARQFGCKALDMEKINHEIGGFDVVVSALFPDANPLSDVNLPPSITILDANYRKSGVGAHAEACGCKVITGQRWLVNQAVESFKLFFGFEPDISLMERGFDINLRKNSINAILCTIDAKVINLANADIVISLPVEQGGSFNTILNEEVSKAFGG